MSKPLCRLCPKPAHFNFREGILLCAECAADILKLCEISPIEQPQRQADQQSQDQAKHDPSIDAGVVVSHDGIPDFLRRTA